MFDVSINITNGLVGGDRMRRQFGPTYPNNFISLSNSAHF